MLGFCSLRRLERLYPIQVSPQMYTQEPLPWFQPLPSSLNQELCPQADWYLIVGRQ